jgi:hypothetical protein
MSDIESTDSDHAREKTLEERDAYEPPRIVVLGTIIELTSGGGGGPGDTNSISTADAARGRGGALTGTRA